MSGVGLLECVEINEADYKGKLVLSDKNHMKTVFVNGNFSPDLFA